MCIFCFPFYRSLLLRQLLGYLIISSTLRAFPLLLISCTCSCSDLCFLFFSFSKFSAKLFFYIFKNSALYKFYWFVLSLTFLIPVLHFLVLLISVLNSIILVLLNRFHANHFFFISLCNCLFVNVSFLFFILS